MSEPKEVVVVECLPNKGVIGKQYKGDAKAIVDVMLKFNKVECELAIDRKERGE